MVPISIVVIFLGLLVFVAHGLEGIFARTKVPDVLLLLFIGLFLGPVFGLVSPEHMGKVGPVFTTLTLVVILFEGGLGLDLKVLARSLVGATGLTIWSFVATLLVLAPIAYWLLDLNWLQSFTLAATLGGTSSAVVIPVVKRLALSEKAKTMLALESALSDVLVIVVALALISAMEGGGLHVGQLFSGMFSSFFIAALIGCLAGFLWSLALRWLHGLKKSIFTTPAFVLVIYGIVESMDCSGAIAALMMGITLGNIRALPPFFLRNHRDWLESPTETELAVFEEVAFLLKTLFFVYIGISLKFSSIPLIYAGLGLAAALFILRIPAVHVSLIPKGAFTRFEAAISGAMNPKGLAAAVVASIPLQRESLLGKPGLLAGEKIQATTFAIVLFTITAASMLIFIIERGWFNAISKILYGRYSPEPAKEEATASKNATEAEGKP
jgi:NhaP-type Na+/H+ or K+/H+ antiporter